MLLICAAVLAGLVRLSPDLSSRLTELLQWL